MRHKNHSEENEMPAGDATTREERLKAKRERGKSDALVVDKVVQGNHDQYEVLVGRYKSLVTTYIFSRINQREMAEDLAQETFVRAFVALANLKNRASFSAWILSIAHNVCIDYLRNKSRTVSLEIHSDKDSKGEIVLENRNDQPIVEKLAMNEIKDRILMAIDGLGEDYRVTLLLRHVSGMSCEEIAEQLDVSLGTVTSRLSRAHKALRERLKKFVDPDK